MGEPVTTVPLGVAHSDWIDPVGLGVEVAEDGVAGSDGVGGASLGASLDKISASLSFC